MNDKLDSVERVIGFDSHPDSFPAALLRGPTPASAVVEKIFHKLPMARLQDWAKKNTTEQDLFVLEASGNSFPVVRTLKAVGRKAKVLESCQMGKLKEAHANNDKISAVRIGKAYLAGTAKEVWVPDPTTQERRDMLHAYRKATKRTTQVRARLLSYLSDNGVRRCGVREIVAFALGAFIGDIQRFAEPKKLVKYCGLDPAFDESGEGEWSGGIGGHGNQYLRCLLIEAAHSILRCSETPLAKWGKRLLARKGEINLVAAAMARKLAVAVWYLMNGRWTPLEEIDGRLAGKVTKMIGSVGERGLKALGKDRKAYRQEIYERLKAGRVYVLDPNKKHTPQPKAKASEAGLAHEYGLR